MSAPVLVVEHETQCPPGWVGEWLLGAGLELDVRRPYLGDPLPDGLTRHGALVVLGGTMNAYDDEDFGWLAGTKELIRNAAEDRTPTLGICLGHQLVAVALGGAVHANPRGQQIGVLPVGWLPAVEGDLLFGPRADVRVAVQWNNDIVSELPERAVVLAETAEGEIQVARFGSRMWGVQSHPEAGAQIVAAWADNDRDHCLERGVDVDEYVGRVAASREELRTSWSRVLHTFAQLTEQVAPAW